MVALPVIVTDKNAEDQCEGKEHIRKEARLSIAHVPGETTLEFGVEFQENISTAPVAPDSVRVHICTQRETEHRGFLDR
ncbi:MAG: hypothetical protein ACL93V_14535 [Candidatus Electrothrix sp. YB6]